MKLKSIQDVDLKNKKVLLRVDFNLPMQGKVIVDAERMLKAIPTIEYILEQHASVLIVSHLGQPENESFDESLSLKPIASKLSELISREVTLLKDLEEAKSIQFEVNKVYILENVRFLHGEKSDSEVLGKELSELSDIYALDCFACAHRKHASIHAAAKFAKVAVAGLLIEQEVKNLDKVLEDASSPIVGVVAGSKVSTKLELLENLIEKLDILILGGGIANTFLAAKDVPIGKSLYEGSLVNTAKRLINLAESKNTKIILPKDVVVANKIDFNVETRVVNFNNEEVVEDEEMILDFSEETLLEIKDVIATAKTILWNGPLGVFEYEKFSNGTRVLAESIAESLAFSVAGGGDTISAINKFKVQDKISYICTGGGAFLSYVKGNKLPGIEVIREKDNM